MILAPFIAALVATASDDAAAPPCAMPKEDRAWISNALNASRQVMEGQLHLPADPPPTIVLFDASCRFQSRPSAVLRWAGERHAGKIRLPDGDEMDMGLASFASRDEESGDRYFVMALPSVWRAARAGPQTLQGLTGVFLHEFSHTRQMDVLKPHFDAAEAAHGKMPDDLTDDSLQKHFQGDPAFVAVVEKETELLYRAAREPDPAKARVLAREALELIEARRKRWFVGEDLKWKSYDDIFLTMEGFGQWVGYAWLADPKGGGMTPAEAEATMRGSKRWWSQEQGLALFLVIDRFVPNWAQAAFAKEPALGIDLLREAVAEPRGSPAKRQGS